MDRIPEENRKIPDGHTFSQNAERIADLQKLPDKIKEFPFIRRFINSGFCKQIFKLQFAAPPGDPSQSMFIVERDMEKMYPQHYRGNSSVYLIDMIGHDIVGYANLVVETEPDQKWNMKGVPYLENTETFSKDFPEIKRKGLSERRMNVAHRYAQEFFQQPLYSGTELLSGAPGLWKRLHSEGKAAVVAEDIKENVKRYVRTD